jgi:U6 snRNA-associated Sm-like protein LSm1
MTIRGENVTICATVDLDREDDPKGLKFVAAEVVRRLAADQKQQKKASDDRKAKALRQAGVEPNIGMHA